MAGGKFSEANLFGITLRESANDGSDFTNPDADYRRVFLGEDGELHKRDSAGAITSFAGSGIATTIVDAKGDVLTATAADTPARLAVSGTDGHVLMEASGEATGLKFAYPGLTATMNQLAADVTMTNANQFYDGPSLALAVGTYVLMASVLVFDTAAGGQAFTAKLWDGTTVASSTSLQVVASSIDVMSLVAYVVVGSPATWKVSVAANVTAEKILAAAAVNGAGNNASTLVALRIA